MKEILLATRNKGKVRELQELLLPLNIKVLTLDEVGPIPDIEEDGDSFAANALKKARETSKESGYICLADDSGLVVDALDGQPGIYSARFAGENATDEENNNKLLSLLTDVEEKERTARFVCAIAICSPQGKFATVEGICEGRIDFAPQGTGGFGYDPLFIPTGYSSSFGELSSAQKHQISHRGEALKKAIPLIANFFRPENRV